MSKLRIADDFSLPADAVTQTFAILGIRGPESKILTVLLANRDGMSNEELAAASGYSHGGGAYNNPRGRLRSLGLIEYQGGKVVPKPLLFLEN